MDDKYARTLIDRATRIAIYRRLNPCNVAMADNCPSAAEALFNYLNERPGRAYCNDVSESFTENPEVLYHSATLHHLVARVRRGPPGNLVVVHATRPPGTIVNGRRMTRDHYFILVRLGPPEDDVFWADCSHPEDAMFFPSRWRDGFTDTIGGMARLNRLQSFEFTRGPFSVRPVPIP
jgi:hypothetical protein